MRLWFRRLLCRIFGHRWQGVPPERFFFDGWQVCRRCGNFQSLPPMHINCRCGTDPVEPS